MVRQGITQLAWATGARTRMDSHEIIASLGDGQFGLVRGAIGGKHRVAVHKRQGRCGIQDDDVVVSAQWRQAIGKWSVEGEAFLISKTRGDRKLRAVHAEVRRNQIKIVPVRGLHDGA